jgi:hypothetical protein
MIIIEYQIAEIFEDLENYAKSLQKTLAQKEIDSEEIKIKIRLVQEKFSQLKKCIPDIKNSNFERHLSFVINRTKEWGKHNIDDIINLDIPDIKKAYYENLKKFPYLDNKLRSECENLLLNSEFDSAVRKAFVVLKDRAVKKYNAPSDIDGESLVNYLFSYSSGKVVVDSDKKKQTEFRNFCSNFFKIFRNNYAHNLVKDPHYVIESVLATINMILKIMDENV